MQNEVNNAIVSMDTDISTVSVLDISTVSVAENTIPTSGESSNGNIPIVYDENGKVIEDFDEVDVRKIEMSNVWSEIYKTVGLLDNAPLEIDILPPHKAKNKGSGKRQMSSKEKAVRKTEKRKRRCGNCKRWVNHNSRTCNLPFVEDLPSDDDERETDDEEEDSSDA
ncbi:hypothetical protein KSS87_005521 [Heliosperma pusillum]|nr:hypothetical protein KSS87_005521 [Heliosperma pusillum]